MQLVSEIEDLRREWSRVRDEYMAREDERRQLLTVLRRPSGAAPPPPPAWPRPAASPSHSPASQSDTVPVRRDRTEWSADRVRDVLLWTGGLLLVLAIVSFVAVLWTRDDDGRPFWTAGRVALLLFALTIGSAVVAVRLRRLLPATAEVVAVLMLALAATDWYAVRRAGFGASIDTALWWSIGAALGTAIAIGAGQLGFRGPRIIAPILGQLSLVFAFAALDDAAASAYAYALGSALSVVVAGRLAALNRFRGSVRTLVVGAACFEFVALVSAAVTLAQVDDHALFERALAVAALGLSPAVARWSFARGLGQRRFLGRALVATSALALQAAALTATDPTSAGVFLAAAAVVGGITIVVAVVLAEPLRGGVAIGGAIVLGLAAAMASASTAITMLLPLTWLEQPWKLDVTAEAVENLVAGEPNSESSVGQWAVVAFLVGPLVAAILASRRGSSSGIAPERVRPWILPVALIWSAIGMSGVVPQYPGVPVVAAWAAALVVALSLVAIGASFERRRPSYVMPMLVASALPFASALGWGLTNRALTVGGFAATAAVVAWSSWRAQRVVTQSVLAAVALAAAFATVCSAVLALGGSAEAAGFAVVAFAAAVVVALAARGGRAVAGFVLEAIAVGGIATGTAMTAGSLSWLASAFTLTTVGFVLAATRPERGVYGWGALGCGAAAVLAWFGAAGVGAHAEGLILAAMSGIVLVAACTRRGGTAATVVEWLAVLGLVTGSSVAADDTSPAWVAGSLTIACVALGVAAILPGAWPGYPYVAAATGGGAVSAWLATADIRTPEAYTATWAAVAIGAGWLLRVQRPSTSSWVSYGPGILIALVPTTWIAIANDELPRTLIALGGGLMSVVIGAARRLQAPLLLGAGVLAAIGIDAVAPAATDLPRWIPLAVIGLLLVWIGATAERRLAQARQLRDLIGEFG